MWIDMEGVLLIDKPKGISSFDVVRKIRSITGIKKIGHTGTLDPLASGLLILCLGKYTKLCSLLMASHKVYEAEIILGKTSSTDDAEGIVENGFSTKHLKRIDVEKTLQTFCGQIEQIPPKFSAIKINGRRAYELARKNEPIALPKRSVEIFKTFLIAYNLPEIIIGLHCSKGTYVRSFARDIGERLKVGAYCKNIRRLKSGNFSIQEATLFEDMSKEVIASRILTGINAIREIENFALTSEDYGNAICGRPLISVYDFLGEFGVATFKQNLVAIVKRNEGNMKIVRVI
jgi:tRNA pseudouridine55 synthase